MGKMPVGFIHRMSKICNHKTTDPNTHPINGHRVVHRKKPLLLLEQLHIIMLLVRQRILDIYR